MNLNVHRFYDLNLKNEYSDQSCAVDPYIEALKRIGLEILGEHRSIG
ncbi:hypothetical protein [Insulibacter thermoxylanivorax]|nr:hypothetical protein [Insulibacter thermoxylanivorax]